MAACAVDDGIKAIVCTPHVVPTEQASALLMQHKIVRDTLQEALKKKGIPLTLLSGAELMLTPELLSFVKKYPEARLAEGKGFLFEITPFIPLHIVLSMVFSARLAGLQPIFAHPERLPLFYEHTKADLTILGKICEQGALLQLTSMSLIGGFGSKVRRCAMSIVKLFPEHIVLGSDAHSMEYRKPLLHAGYACLSTQARALAQEHWRHLCNF